MSNYNIETPVFSRFFENLPDYPHCTDKLEAGCKQAPKRVAIKRRYIQFNKPNYSHTYLNFDLDYEGAGLAWHDLDLPCPTFSIVNPENAHGLTAYELTTPVHLGGNASKSALGYLDVIRQGYIRKLNADPSFNEFIAKNPLSNAWRVFSCNATYELDELAEPLRDISADELFSIPIEEFDERIKDYLIPLNEKRKAKRIISTNPDDSLFVFHNTRWYMYSITPDCKRHSELYSKAEAYIRELSADFSLDLVESHIRFNAKSVAKFCWNHRDEFIAKRIAFCELQRERAYRSHKARKRNNKIKIQKARHSLRKAGKIITKSALAEETGLSRRALDKRILKTDPSEAKRIGAYNSHDVRKAATEEKITDAVDKFLREGKRVSKVGIAREAEVTRQTLDRYQHLLP